MNLRCDFKALTGGAFAGTAYPYYPSSLGSFTVSGTFTFSVS